MPTLEFIAEIKMLEAKLKDAEYSYMGACADTERFEKENKLLRNALEFYADEDEWPIYDEDSLMTPNFMKDKGKRAREVLKKKEKNYE